MVRISTTLRAKQLPEHGSGDPGPVGLEVVGLFTQGSFQYVQGSFTLSEVPIYFGQVEPDERVVRFNKRGILQFPRSHGECLRSFYFAPPCRFDIEGSLKPEGDGVEAVEALGPENGRHGPV